MNYSFYQPAGVRMTFVPTGPDGEDGAGVLPAGTGPVAPVRPDAVGTLDGLVAPDMPDTPDTLEGLEIPTLLGGSEVMVAVALSFDDVLDLIGITSLSPISAREFEME